ncbi:YSIRK-type signal peptide-containing protein [Streptococcus pluranimalium]
MKRSFNLTKNKNMYSIRKYHFGAAGVLLGASLALGTGTALAEEQGVTTTTPNTALTTETSVQPTETAVTPVITEPLITADPVTTESEAEESITSEAGAPVLASSPTETVTESITPSNVAISISGTDRNNQPIADQSVIQQGTIMTVGFT